MTLKEDSKAPTPAKEQSLACRLAMRLVGFICAGAALWLLFYAVWIALPGLQSGSDQVSAAKRRYIRQAELFPKDAEVRVIVYGNSKVLSGFKPELFRELSGGRVHAFNMGMPGSNRFIDELEEILERGPAPTHVFLTLPWAMTPAPSSWEKFRDDTWLMDQLFPFRRLPRDFVLFVARSRSHGGMAAYYRRVLDLLDRMIADRGYHFIESQSHFPGHQLPEDFRLDQDSTDRIWTRDCGPSGPVYYRLQAVQEKYGVSVYFVPTYYREGEYGESPTRPALAERLRGTDVKVLGPSYWLLPNRYFSDPVHLNSTGSDRYTTMLWRLTKDNLQTRAGTFDDN